MLPEVPIFTPTDAFLESVLLDGRFIESVYTRPREAANTLGIDISDEVVAEITTAGRRDLLNRLFDARFSSNSTNVHPYIVYESSTAGVGFIIGGVVVGIAIVAIVVLAARTTGIQDFSRERETKL